MASYQPGDIVMTRSPGLLGKLIRFFTRSVGERRTKVSHVGVMVNETEIVEARRRVVRHPLKETYAGTPTAVAIVRGRDLSAPQRRQVAEKADSYVGRSYGYAMIVAHALDYFLLGAYVFRRLIRTDKYPICNWVVAYSYHAIGRDFGVEPWQTDPDTIWDYTMEWSSKAMFDVVHELGPLER